MKTYETEFFVIETNDLNSEVYTDTDTAEMIDFYLHYNDKIYDGTAVTTKLIEFYFSPDRSHPLNYYRCSNMIVIRQCTIECLTQTLNEIIEDEMLFFEDLFTIVNSKDYFDE